MSCVPCKIITPIEHLKLKVYLDSASFADACPVVAGDADAGNACLGDDLAVAGPVAAAVADLVPVVVARRRVAPPLIVS